MSQKGLAPILIVLILAALVGGYLIYTNYELPVFDRTNSRTETTPPQQTASIDETADWKTYENGAITFKYPPTWKTSPTNTDYLIFNDGKIEKSLLIDQEPLSTTFNNWCKQDATCKTHDNFEKIKVAGYEAYQYTFTKECNGCNYPFTTYYILPNDNLHTVVSITKTTYAKPAEISHQEEVDALKDPVFDQILSTFKFTN